MKIKTLFSAITLTYVNSRILLLLLLLNLRKQNLLNSFQNKNSTHMGVSVQRKNIWIGSGLFI